MHSKKIFKKKNQYFKYIYFTIFSLFLLIIYFLYYKYSNNKIFIVEVNNNDFYVVPKDRQGQKVANINKKILHMIDKKLKDLNNENTYDLSYSIQFFASSVYDDIDSFLHKLTDYDEMIYDINDFYILTLTTNIGVDYFLLYKNFQTHEAASKYCNNYLNQLDNCLIINVNEFN